jgi:hypothetical protein
MRFLVALLRLASGLLTFVILALVALMIGAGALLYLSASGRDLTGLRAAVRGAGRLFAGQHTDRLTLTVSAIPQKGSFSGTASLGLRSLEEGRRRFFFLLNEGLRIRSVRLGDNEAAAYRLGPLLIVDIGDPIAVDQQADLTISYEGRLASGILGANFVFEPDHIRLPVDSFWYPNDVQSFASVDVTATLPAELTVVHNGQEQSVAPRGALRSTRWSTARPIGGMALVAGRFEETSVESGGIRYRLFASPDERLDAQRVVALLAEADGLLSKKLGPSGFPQVTAFVSNRLRRAFNDGSGVIGLTDRYFQRGDYGFGLLAHELAHNWWGGTVAEKWLTPGTGGEWLVEGFAEFSSMLASEEKYGAPALTLRLTDAFFDPARQRSITELSVFDNYLAEDISRDTIYRKGAYVAFMLRHIIGAPAYYAALSQFLERFRYRQATDADMQHTLEEITGLDLAPFFEDWVRSNRLADLALEKTKQGDLEVTNHGAARVPGELVLWKFRDSTSAPEIDSVRVGDRIAAEPGIDFILDPQLHWADVERENNRFPRRSNPVDVAVSPAGRTLVTYGEMFSWARATVRETAAGAGESTTWDFTRGFAQTAKFGRGTTTAVAGYSEGEPLPAVVTLTADGSRRTLGRGSSPALLENGNVIAAARERLIELAPEGSTRTLVHRKGFELGRPEPDVDERRLAYTSRRGNEIEVRMLALEDGSDALLLAWHGDEPRYVWSADGQRLCVTLGVGADWQIWALPVAGVAGVEQLVTGAARISDLALSGNSDRLAFTAVPELDYPFNRHRLYVQPLAGGEVQTFDLGGEDAEQVTWMDADTLLVVTRELPAGDPWILPATRAVRRVRLSTGAVEDLP